MESVFLCSPVKLGELNLQLIERIRKSRFDVSCAMLDTRQDLPYEDIFLRNIGLIKKSDIFVAVLKDYGKDLTAEVGIVYAWGIPSIGIDYNAKQDDVMSYYALDKVVKPEQLEETLEEFRCLTGNRLSRIGERANKLEDEVGITPDDVLNKLAQEVGEFNDAVQKFRGRYCKTKGDAGKIVEEAGDLIFNVVSICSRYGIDPDSLPSWVRSTLSKFNERKGLYLSTQAKAK